MLSSIGLGLLLICCVNLGGRAWTREEELQYKTESRCRCQSTDRCWPSPREWTALNALVNGNLLALRPVASVCHDPTFDEAVCENVSASYTSAAWRADQPGTCNWALLEERFCRQTTDQTNAVRPSSGVTTGAVGNVPSCQ